MKTKTISVTEFSDYTLSGSRLFASKSDLIKINDETDYDFCAEYSKEESLKLEEIGLECIIGESVQDYTDMTSVEIGLECIIGESVQDYTDMTSVEIWIAPKIQVVLRKDCIGWMKMINSITPEFYRDYVWKSGPNFPKRQAIKDILNQLYVSSK